MKFDKNATTTWEKSTNLLCDLLTKIVIWLDKDRLLLDCVLRRLLGDAGAAKLRRRGRLAGHVAGDARVRRVLPRVVLLACGEEVKRGSSEVARGHKVR